MILTDGNTSMSEPTASAKKIELMERIETIEAAYEFMLAYAAQGHEPVPGTAHEGEIRAYLHNIDQALAGLSQIIRDVAIEKNAAAVESYRYFIDVLDDDGRKSQAAIMLVLAQEAISSQLIDNLNASIHLRALLTDLFVFDEAWK